MKTLLIIIMICSNSLLIFGQNDSVKKETITKDNKSLSTKIDVKKNTESEKQGIKNIKFKDNKKKIWKEFEKDKISYLSLPLVITKNDTIRKEIEINIEDEYITATINDCFLLTRTIKIKPNQNINDTVQIIFGIYSSTELDSNFIVYKLTASIDSIKSDCIISILPPKESHNLTQFDDFIIQLGASFDFASKIKVNTLYAKVSFFHPNMVLSEREGKYKYKSHFKNLKSNNKTFFDDRVGIYTGLYQNNFISIDSSTSGIYIEYLTDKTKDTLSFVDNRVKYKSKSTINNLSLFFGIPVRLTPLKKPFNIYFSPEFEILKINTATIREYQIVSSDTLLNQSQFFHRGFISNSGFININQKEIIKQYYLKNFGVASFILTYKNERNMIFLSCTLWGLGCMENPTWKSYYQYKFEIIETQYGLSLGGEFRGFYGDSPIISIHLSKLFKLSKLIEFQ